MEGSLPDFGKFLDALQAQGSALADAAADAVRQRAPVSKSPAQNRAPGTFRDSITGTAEATGDGLRIVVDSDDEPVKTFVLKGTAAHEIVPNNAKALRFVAGAGGVVFTRHVNHPGTAPNPFADDALDAIVALGEDAVQQALAAVTA